MKPVDPFLTQILAAPDDSALRLVYADWLEEHGDDRCEFIRLQAQMSAVAPYSDEYARMRTRRNALRPKMDATWLEAMGYVPRHLPLFQRLPPRRAERWRLVEEFVGTWYSPLSARDGFSEAELTAAEKRLGFPLPAALREWYALAGKRKDVWSAQDHLSDPAHLTLDNERDLLVFYIENQGCERWGIRVKDLALEDPPVFEVFNRGKISPTTTAFALMVLVYAVQFAPNVLWEGGDVAEAVVRPAVKQLKKCQLPRRFWVANPIVFYEGTDLIVEFIQRRWVYLAARTEAALEQVGDGIRRRMERYG